MLRPYNAISTCWATRRGEATKYDGDFIVAGAAFVAGVTAIGARPVRVGILVVTTGYYIIDVTTNGFGLDYSPKKQINK